MELKDIKIDIDNDGYLVGKRKGMKRIIPACGHNRIDSYRLFKGKIYTACGNSDCGKIVEFPANRVVEIKPYKEKNDKRVTGVDVEKREK